MNDPIKMVATDLDGTLLRNDKTVSEYTIDILTRCREKGIKTVYATGRGGSSEWLTPGDLFDGKISMNGAVAKTGDTVIYSRLIPWRSARLLLIACDKQGIKTAAQLSGTDYSNFNVTREWPWIKNFQQVDFAYHELDAEKIYAVPNGPGDIAAFN